MTTTEYATPDTFLDEAAARVAFFSIRNYKRKARELLRQAEKHVVALNTSKKIMERNWHIMRYGYFFGIFVQLENHVDHLDAKYGHISRGFYSIHFDMDLEWKNFFNRNEEKGYTVINNKIMYSPSFLAGEVVGRGMTSPRRILSWTLFG